MLCVRAQVVPGRELQYHTLVALTEVERTGGGGEGAKARGRHWHANLLLNYQKVAVALQTVRLGRKHSVPIYLGWLRHTSHQMRTGLILYDGLRTS